MEIEIDGLRGKLPNRMEERMVLLESVELVENARLCVESWQTKELCSRGDFECLRVQGGLTNELTIVRLKHGKKGIYPKQVLHRAFGKGTGALIDREFEHEVVYKMAEIGIAPRVFGRYVNGRCEEWIDAAEPFDSDLFRSDEAQTELAKLLYKMHHVRLDCMNSPVPQEPTLIKRMREWLWEAKQVSFVDQRRSKQLIALDVENLSLEVDWLIPLLKDSGSPVVLCHGDLHSGNFLFCRASNEYKLIDFEYSTIDFRGMDFGNLFNELTLNNFISKHPGFTLNPENYPNDERQERFFESYLGVKRGELSEVVQQMKQEAKLFTLASHLLWTLWAIVQARHSSIKFGYLFYGLARLEQYFACKESL